MKRIVDLLVAERVVIAVILLNSVALVALGYTATEDRTTSLWFAVDLGCVVFFALEAMAKIGRQGFRPYWASGWDRFDFLVTVASLPVLLSPVLPVSGFSEVLILRLGRLFRLFRLLRFIPNRAHLVTGIRRALTASVGVFLALALLNLILAMGATFLFGEIAPEYFGNPGRSLYSLFRIFTVEGWYEVPEVVAAHTPSTGWLLLVRLYCIFALILGGILGLSLANAVFVDEMMVDNTFALEAKVDALHEELRSLRRELDRRAER